MTAAFAFPGVVIGSVREGVSVVLAGAYILVLTLVEFHNTSISTLMASSTPSAILRKAN